MRACRRKTCICERTWGHPTSWCRSRLNPAPDAAVPAIAKNVKVSLVPTAIGAVAPATASTAMGQEKRNA